MNPSERIQQLAAFPQTNPNPVMAFGPDGVMTYSNEAARKLASSLDADSPSEILPQDIKTIIAECLLTGENVTNLQTTLSKRTISWSFIPVTGDQVVHCYANDITDRLILEAQLRYIRQDGQAVGQLAAGVAHDFNNILTIIQGHADLLLQAPAEEKEKAVRTIAAAAERAGKLIKQLLVFSRKQAMRQRALQLNEVVQNLVPMLRGLLGDSVDLQFIPAQNLPPLSADLGMLEQVLVNLVLNARDAMPRGGLCSLSPTSQQTLGTGGFGVEPGGASRRIRLPFGCRQSTGCRNDPDDSPRPFVRDHFFHHQRTRKRDRSGTGDRLRHRQTAPGMDHC